MRIAVCDDEKIARDHLVHELNIYADSLGLDLVIYQYSDGNELLEKRIEYDIVFMDYRLKDMNGLETVAILRKRNINTIVIFVSCFQEVVFDSMKVGAFRFLVKPFKRGDLYEALDSVVKIKRDEAKILLRSMDREQSLNIFEKDIIYAQADSHHVVVTTKNGSYLYAGNISAFEEELTGEYFFRTNRSYIVNFDHIANYSKKQIELTNGHKALLTASRSKDFRVRYLNHLGSQVHFRSRS